jgi:hypothetical protein
LIGENSKRNAPYGAGTPSLVQVAPPFTVSSMTEPIPQDARCSQSYDAIRTRGELLESMPTP